MSIERRARSFSASEIAEIAARMDKLAEGADGRQWVNIEPDVDESEVSTGSVFFKVFSARGPVVPQATWTPAHRSGKADLATSLGIRHGTGTDATGRLARLGVPVDGAWVIGSDHPKHGLVLYVPPDAETIDVVDWTLRALRSLAPFEFHDAWTVVEHQRSGR